MNARKYDQIDRDTNGDREAMWAVESEAEVEREIEVEKL